MIQTVHDGRQFMKYIDPKLGVPLPERDYGGNCLMYDPGNTTDPFHNIWVRLFILFCHLRSCFLQVWKVFMTQFLWGNSYVILFETNEYVAPFILNSIENCLVNNRLPRSEISDVIVLFVLWYASPSAITNKEMTQILNSVAA